MVESIYDNIQIPGVGADLLGFGFGICSRFADEPGGIAIVGSALAVALGILNLNTAWEAIDPDTIVFLLGMMVVNSALGVSGFFQLALEFLTRFTRSPFGILREKHFMLN